MSNLGSSLGTALAGSALAAAAVPGGRPFILSTTILVAFSLVGLVIALLLPRQPAQEPAQAT